MEGSARRSVVWPVRVDPTGVDGPTPKQARGPGFRGTTWGFFVPSSVDPGTPEQRIAEAGMVLPSFGGVTGWGALRWHGCPWFSGRTPSNQADRAVTLAVGACDVRRRAGIDFTHERLAPGDIVRVDQLRVVTPVAALSFDVRYASSLWSAVEAIDMAAYSDLVSLRELGLCLEGARGWTGVILARRALALADENSWSPKETWLRLVWMLVAGLEAPLCNVPIFDVHGRHLSTPDLFDPVAAVAGEYDGADHREQDRRRRDLGRQDDLRRVGIETVTVVAGDTVETAAARILDVRRTALAGATRKGPGGWTLTPPPWWVPTRTVEQRRALTPAQGERWLRHRLRIL